MNPTAESNNANSQPELHRSRAEDSGADEFISVIMPVRNESRSIANTIQMLLQQDYPSDRFEVLVVDGCSTDDTRQIVQSFCERDARVRLLENPKRLSSSARNLGVQAARGTVIVIVDGHCEIPHENLFSNLSQLFRESKASVIGRPQPLKATDPNMVQIAIAHARSSWLGHHPDSFIYESGDHFTPASSVGAAYRKEVFDQIGLFDESFDACEDVDFNTRSDQAGLSCFFSCKVQIYYHPRRTLLALFQQMARYGKGRVRLAAKHRQYTLKAFLPMFFVLGLIVGPITFPLGKFFIDCYLAVVGIYAATLTLTSFLIARREHSFSLALVLPLVFATIHLGAGWGILTQVLKTPFVKKDQRGSS